MLSKEKLQEIKKIFEENENVIIDFWAEWCGPCKLISNTLKEIEEKYKNKIYILKINIDEYPEISNVFEIKSIPTLIFVKNKIIKEIVIGAKSFSVLENNIKNNFNL